MRLFRFSPWVTAVAVAVFPQFDSGAQGDRFVQDRFVIGFWCDPPADEKMSERYQEIAEANFTLVLGGFSATTPETIERQLDLCRKYDLRALVLLTPYAMDALPDGPECWGYVLLMKATSTGVYRLPPEDDPAQVLAGTPLKTISRAPEDPPNDYLIGTFELTDGRTAVILNNYRTEYTAWPTIEFRAELGRVTEASKKNGLEVPVVDDSPDTAGLQLSLDAGDARLFLMAP